MGDATAQMAAANPNVNFAIIDFSTVGKPINGAKNVKGLLFKEQEAGYLAGYLAGLFQQTKAKGLNAKNTIGSVGGQKIPPVDRYIAGFKAGAKKADPKITVLNGYSNDFVKPAPCAEQSLAQIGRGADIEFQVAGQCGLGTLSTAKDKKIWGIGVDADQAYLGPHILTSALKRVNVAVADTIGDAVGRQVRRRQRPGLLAEGQRRRPRQDQRGRAEVDRQQGQPGQGADHRGEGEDPGDGLIRHR